MKLPEQGILMAGPLEIYVTLVLTALAAILMGLFVSSLAPNANTVIYMILLVVFGQILLTGTIFKLPEAGKPASYAIVTRWSLEALGSTANMEALNEQTQTRMRKSITVEHSPKPEDLGKAFKDLVDQGAVPAPFKAGGKTAPGTPMLASTNTEAGSPGRRATRSRNGRA